MKRKSKHNHNLFHSTKPDFFLMISWVMLLCSQISIAQENLICNSDSTWLGVDMDENNGAGTTNSVYEWYVAEEEFEGEIYPQTDSGNQIIIEWLSTPTGSYTVFVEEFNSQAICDPNPEVIKLVYVNATPHPINGNSVVCEGDIVQLNHPESNDGEWGILNNDIATIYQNGEVHTYESGETEIHFSYNIYSCELTSTTDLEILSRPNPNLEDSVICLNTGESEIIDSGLSSENYTFNWYENGNPIEHSLPYLEVSETGVYELSITDNNTNCSSNIISIQVVEIISPDVSVTVDTGFNSNQNITVNIENPDQYTFQLGNQNPQNSNVFQNVSLDGTHTIYIREINGCYELEIDVHLINYPLFFTPNNDGYNDTWNITSLKYDPSAVIYIYDRFGKLLKTLSPSAEGWDGTYRGNEMPSNDYWFSAHYTDRANGAKRIFKSNFTLKR